MGKSKSSNHEGASADQHDQIDANAAGSIKAVKDGKGGKPAKVDNAAKPAKSKSSQVDRAKSTAKSKSKVKQAGEKRSQPQFDEPQAKRAKLVRDSFTMPSEDFELIAKLKERALEFRRPTKKSELLRAGLQLLSNLDQSELQFALEQLRPLKVGRPKHMH